MAQDEFSTMMGWEGSDERCSISEFKESLRTANLSSKEKPYGWGWVFWYPKPEDELLDEYDFAQMVQQNSNVCEEDEREKKIKSVLEEVTSNYNDCIVQFWGKKVVAGQLCLTTVGQPFAVGCLRLLKGYCWYRKHCEDQQYIVKEEEVGSVGRAFLNKKVESSPDLRLYSIQEFPLRNHAARTGLTSYLAMPIFDLLNNECYGVLEILSSYYSNASRIFSLLDQGLKVAGLRSTHIHSSPINFFNRSKLPLEYKRQPESEIVKMMESAMEAVPQLQTVQLWTPCNQCVTSTNTLTCLERTAFINFKDKKLNFCNIWEDSTLLNFLEACEFHHLQIEEWIGRPLMSVNRRSSFCRSICDFSICEYPLAHYAQKARLSFRFVIHLQNIYDSNNHCFLEFFVQPSSAGDACDASFLHLLLRIMEMEIKNFKFDKSIFELRKTSALGYEYVEWKHQHSEEVNMLTVMKGHTERYSLSDFKIYLQTPDLSCLQPCEERRHVWLFWREEMSYNEVNNNRGLQEEIRKLMMAITSKCSLVMDSVPSVLQEKSKAATSESREKGVAKEKLVRKRNGSLHIRLEDLEPHFGKKIEHAADALGVGRSTIKRACRIHGIDRWPSNEKYIKNRRLFEAAGTSHDFQHSHSINLPPPYVPQPVTELQPEAEMVMVKAKYEDEIIKFKLCLSATMNKLLEEVAKRLALEIGSFKLRYLDEDNDEILLTCDDDLQLCLKGLTACDKTCVQVFVQLIRK